MRETSDLGGGTGSAALPLSAVALFAETQAALSMRSVVVWGEHCTECAFPACYGECSFYTPRPDHHCRRFENGIERVAADNGAPISLARIRFRRWGKLEGRGRIGLKSVRRANRLEWADRVADKALSSPLPAFLTDTIKWRLNESKRRSAGRGDDLRGDDLFIMEAWNDGRQALPFTLSIMTEEKQADGLYQVALHLAPGYTRLVKPVREIAALVDLTGAVTLQIEPVGEHTPTVIFGLIDFVRLSKPLAPHTTAPARSVSDADAPKIKCLVWDLDNTLWNGVLVEDGIDGVSLRPEAAQLVRDLDRRGIINSIASKNDKGLAFLALERFGLRDHFVFPQISWGPKSEAIRDIIALMDVGQDTFAFIDDQAFERGEIQQLLPQVAVFSDENIRTLGDHVRFDVPVTAESGQRRRMYQTEERRKAAQSGAAVDYTGFLRSCEICLDVAPLTAATVLRAYELSQRTNQLNLSGRRYSQAELEALLTDRPQDVFVLSCSDRFGDYGAIGLCVLQSGGPAVESFFMSCRVQRKRVENAFFQYLTGVLAMRGARRLELAYRATPKNGAAVEMVKALGFDLQLSAEGEGLFVRALTAPIAEHDVVRLVAPVPLELNQAVA